MNSLEFAEVGNSGNPGDTADSNGSRFGQVNHNYRIAKYETTYGQYIDFLNAVAKSDPNALFNPGMQYDKLLNGISREGTDGNYAYKPLNSASANKPVNYVNFLDAVRFCNWMHNGQGNGDTESGAYTITTAQLVGATRRNHITTYKAKGKLDLKVGDQAQTSGLTGSGFEARSTIKSILIKKGYTYFTIENDHPDEMATGKGVLTAISATHTSAAKYWIPTENEWYKAAYYNPTLNGGKGGYFDWATQSDSSPGNTIGDSPNQANIRTSKRFTNSDFFPRPDPLIGPNLLTEVGSFTNSSSYYGTFDQDGNVTEWNESIYDPIAFFGNYNGSDNGTRSKRGASFYNSNPGSAIRDDGLMPNDAGYAAGFRLAAASTDRPASTDSPGNTQDSGGTDVPGSTQASASTDTSSRAKLSGNENKILVYEGILSSANEVWPTVTPATGTIKLTLNEKRNQAIYELNVIGLDFGKWYDGQPRTADTGDDVAGLHFHHAPFYTVGDVCIGLIGANQENDLKYAYNERTSTWTLTGKWTAADHSLISLDDSLQYIYNGELYANFHTERVALGEIRAQFSPVENTSSSQLLAAIAPYTSDNGPHPEDHCCNPTETFDDSTCSHPDEHCCETQDTKIQHSTSSRDWLTGKDGEKDVFCYDSWKDSRYERSRFDVISNFNSSEDLIDLHSLDADSRRPGHQSFTWIGDNSFKSAFSGARPGQLRYSNGVLSADMNGDMRPDFAIDFNGSPDLTASNIIF